MGIPLWSVTIPTYNAAPYIKETLESVLAQDPGQEEMEIIIVDNCSTDSTIEIAESIGKARVKIISNDVNIGPHGNFNKCIEVATGELIHMLHADDLVMPGFYKKFADAFKKYDDVSIIFCKSDFINDRGEVINSTSAVQQLLIPSKDISAVLYHNPFVTPAVVVRKSAYEKLGGFDTQFSFVADWDMWVRVIANLKGFFIEDILTQYRLHSENGTAKLNESGEDIVDYERIYKKFQILGYPVDINKTSKYLRDVSEYSYVSFYYKNNHMAAAKALNLYRRNTSAFAALLLANKTKVRLMLSKIKKAVLLKKL